MLFLGTNPLQTSCGRQSARTSMTVRPARRAFTLLELMLALALTAVALVAVNMAVTLHLRLFDSRRSYLEESQLAREVLRLIADDIRGAVVPYEQDVSCLSQMLGASRGRGGAAGGGGTGGSPGGSATPSATEGAADLAGEAFDETESSAYTQDLSAMTALPAQPGIFGNQYELQIDVSRLPREDQYYAALPATPGDVLRDIPSDVKTVTYYVISSRAPAAQAELAVSDLSRSADPDVVGRGLVRRQLDRCVTEWALNNANATALMQQGEVIAPEAVGIEFLYFDGFEWRTEWDSQLEGGLPVAIQILLMFGDMPSDPAGSLSGEVAGNVRFYRAVVHLPMVAPLSDELSDLEMMGL